MKYVKAFIILLPFLIVQSCSHSVNMPAQQGIDSTISTLKDATKYISLNLLIPNKSIKLYQNFSSTDMKRVRKMPLLTAVKLGFIPENIYETLKDDSPEDSFVLLIWDKWYRKWAEGDITPYVTFDPLKDEKDIKLIPLYRNGKVEKVITPEEFDNYPVIVISPEWWEGNKKQKIAHNTKATTTQNYAVSFARGMYIGKNFDGSWNPMEIYTVCVPVENINYAKRTDFNSGQWDVNWANRWYYFDPLQITYYYHFTNPAYMYSPEFDCKVWEQDGGLRFSDDYVGYVRITYSGSGYYYYSGGYAQIYAHIGFVQQ